MRPNKLKQRTLEFGAQKGLLQGHARRMGGSFSKKPELLQGFNKALLKAKWGRVMVGCCKLLGVGILCSCSHPHSPGHDVSVNLQQDKYYLFCNFVSLYKWKLVILFPCGSVGKIHLAHLVKNPPAMQESWVRSRGREDPLEKEQLPAPVYWPGEFHGLYSPWGHKQLDTTEGLSLSLYS